METNQPGSHGFWRYLINSQKRATPQLEQLCLGIAKVIPTLEPRSDSDLLTPQRLALFYRAVGGNYDSLFLNTSEHGLSFMYTTLGCFHSLQPTLSPFDTPKIPCLTPDGFARWLTIQMLLCPEENIGFLQKSVQVWNIPGPNGTIFPKYIPREVFPTRPDEEMENWHRMVTGRLNQKNYMRRIQNSPHHSPHPDAHDRRDGYFSGSQVGRPSRPSRSSSRDDKTALYRRRSSVPEFISPGAEHDSRWDPRDPDGPRKARSHSAQRSPAPPPGRQRSHTASGSHTNQPPSSNPNSPSSRRHGPHHTDQNGRRSSGYNTKYRSPARTPSTVDEDTGGSEASSENSQAGHRPRRPGDGRQSRRSSLWVPSIFRSHKRRHSSDASYRAPSKHTQPLRPEYYRANNPQPPPRGPGGGGSAPQFRETNWDGEPPPNPNPTSPVQGHVHPDPRAPTIRYPDQNNFGQPLTRESSSGSGTDHRHRTSDYERNGHRRGQAIPPRIATVAGVHGRQYPDALNPIERQRSHVNSRGGVAAVV